MYSGVLGGQVYVGNCHSSFFTFFGMTIWSGVNKKKVLYWIIGGVIAVCAIGFSIPSSPSTPSTILTTQSSPISSVEPTYDDIFRYNEQYIGKQVNYLAEVIQVKDDGANQFRLRANITKDANGWSDTVYLNYTGQRFLEKDIIYFKGTIKGLKTYTTVRGDDITIPEINIIQANLITKAGDRTN